MTAKMTAQVENGRARGSAKLSAFNVDLIERVKVHFEKQKSPRSVTCVTGAVSTQIIVDGRPAATISRGSSRTGKIRLPNFDAKHTTLADADKVKSENDGNSFYYINHDIQQTAEAVIAHANDLFSKGN